jgi:hypothetical protein
MLAPDQGPEGINFMRMYSEPSCTPSRAAVLTSTRGQRLTTSGRATSAGKVICSLFSVEGFPSRASVEGEHGETGLSLPAQMLSQADGGP